MPVASISVHIGWPVSSTLPCPQFASFSRRRRANREKSKSPTSNKPTAAPTAIPAFAPAVSVEDATGACVEADEASVGEEDAVDSNVELVERVV